MGPCIMSYYIIIVYLMISLGLGNLENVFCGRAERIGQFDEKY